jgi:sulfonate transport system substrate-binding protein
MRLRLGLHPHNLSLRVLSGTHILEDYLHGRNVDIEWVRFPDGPRTPDYIGAGILDIGGTGATPPIAGQAKGIPLVYVATSAGRAFGGIAVAADGPIRELADLQGKRVGLAAGSWLQALLVTALGEAGVPWSEIVPLDLPDGHAEAALRRGGIDAWATGNLLEDPAFRFVARTGGIISNPSVFFAGRAFAEDHRDVLERVVAAIDDADAWTATHSTAAAHILAADAEFGGKRIAWEAVVRARAWGLRAIEDGFLDEQQRTADAFFRHGLIGRRIDVRDAQLARALAVGTVGV